MKNVRIPDPCSESWELMSPQEKGRFCSVCSKCVIDFTEKQPEEIQQIFVDKKDKSICGRFYSHQLTKEIEKPERLKTQFLRYVPSNFQNSRIAFALFSLILFLTGCSKPKETTYATIGMVAVEEDSIPKNENYEIGKVIKENDSVAKMPKKDSVSKNKSAK
jgi:hypothetical protein